MTVTTILRKIVGTNQLQSYFLIFLLRLPDLDAFLLFDFSSDASKDLTFFCFSSTKIESS